MKLKYAGHMANDIYWFIFPLILPMLIERFGLSFGEGGGILTLYLLLTAIGSFFIGKLSDYFPRREIMGFGFIAAAFGLAATGMTSNLTFFLILVALTGLAMSSFHPVMYAVIAEGEDLGRAKTLSRYESFGTLGILLMFLINGFLIERIGFQGVLIATALPGLIMGFIFLKADSLKETRDLTKVRPGRSSADSGSLRILIVFLLSVMLRVFSVTAVLNFLPTIFVNFAGFSVGMASYSTAFFFAGGIAGSLFAGRLAGQLNSLMILLGGTILLCFILPLFGLGLSGGFLILVVVLLGFLGSGCLINQNIVISRMGRRYGRGEIYGILMGIMTVTSSISPALYGSAIDFMGIQKTQWLFTLPMVMSAFILAVLGPREEGVASQIPNEV